MIILTIISLCPKSKIKYYDLIKTIMRYVLPTISLSFFGQIFESLLLIYICDETIDKDKYNSFECPNKSLFYLLSVLSAFGILFLVVISYITISVYYKPAFLRDKNNSLSKMDAFPNLVFFVNKILFIVLTNINSKSPIYIWFMLIVFLISTYANMIAYTKYNNYINKALNEINRFFSVLLFSFICYLILGKIFNAWGFNGTIYINLFGLFISLITAFLYKSNLNSFSYLDFKSLNSRCEQIIYIKDFLELVKTRHLCREKTLTFDSLILIKEENCINKNCKLKKYLKSVEKGQPNDFLLYQYCQFLYELAIKKFPDDTILKINYVVYLIVQMSKRKLAEKVFYTIKFSPFHPEANFMMFCCNKFIKTYSNNNSGNIFKEENKNVMKKLEYDKLYEEFKEDLIQASSLYYEFWNILNKYHVQGVEEFDKLKSIGKELSVLIANIEKKFNILHNVKGDDANLLFLYSGFIKYILGDKSKYDNLRNILVSISNVDKIKDFEIDYTNFDIKYYSESDEYKYVIVSAEEENLGTIMCLSHNAAKIFGYSRQELIGKKFWFLLPCISAKEFKSFLVKHTNKLKIKFYEALGNKKEYFPQVDELFINTKDKSKYLIPVYIKMIFVQTEESDHAYIMNLSYLEDINLNKMNDIFNIGSIFNSNKQKEEKIYKYCIILTDMNFIIQTFTANCQEHLGLNTHSMGSNIDITQFISEFNDAVYKIILEKRRKLNERADKNDVNIMAFESTHRSERRSKTGMVKFDDISPEKKIICKRYIAEKNYSESKLVTWKSDVLENYLVNNKSAVEGTNISSKMNKNNLIQGINEDPKEKIFLLIIKKAEFDGQQFGYIFLLRREQVNCLEKNENVIKSSINDLKSAQTTNKNKSLLKVHHPTFSTFKSSDNLNDKKDNEEKKDDNNNNKKENNTNNNIEVVRDIKYSKSQKKKMKMRKSLDLELVQTQNKENIVGIIESKIKNILNDDSFKKNTPIKKCSFKNLSSHLSLVGNDNKSNNEESPDIVSEKKILESILKSQNYTPKCNFNFSLDMNLMSFRPSYTLLKAKDFSELLKNEAQKKINLTKNLKEQNEKNKNDDSSFYSSNEENESYENEEISSSKTINDSKKEIPKKTIEKKKKEENTKSDISKEYYRVSGLNKIKLMIFDFEQEMVVEKDNNQKEFKSEVENIITNFKLKLPTAMDKDGNDPSIKVNKFLSKYSNKDIIKDKIIRMDSTSQVQNTQKIKKQKELCKKIETELNKREKEKSIFSYSIICAVLNLFLLGIGAFSLYFILYKFSIFKNHLLLLIYSSLLRHYTNLGIYHTRMYTLSKLNIPDYYYSHYSNYYIEQNATEYIKNLSDKLQNDFFKGSECLEKMIAIDIELNKKNEEKLYSNSFNNSLMGNNFAQKNVSTSYIVGISEIYSHFYYLIANIDNLKYNSPEVLNFLLNALNNAGTGLNEIIEVYIDEIKVRKGNHAKLTYIILSVYFILLILVFFPVKFNYAHIIFKRDSYVSILYQINLSFIRTSILKCEKFLNQLNPNELIMNKEENKDAMDNTVSISNFDDNLLSNDQMKKNMDNKSNQSKLRKGNMKMKGNKKLMVTFVGFLLAIFLYMLIPLMLFNNYISKFEIMALYMYHMLHYHNNIINIYNGFNEYLFYESSTIDNKPVLEYIEKTINNTYDTLAEDLNYLGTYSKKIDGLYDIYSMVQKEQLCSNTLCDPYIETITSLGYYSFVAFMMTEIKVKVNYVKILNARRHDTLNEKGDEGRALMLFNTMHYDVDLMFNFVALHYIEEEVILTVDTIFENINSNNAIYLVVFIVFFVLIICLYIFYWYPFINDAQEQIYKTKEALNIIPVDILESQTNIKNLLGISDLNE